MKSAEEILNEAKRLSAAAGNRDFSKEVKSGIGAFIEHNKTVQSRKVEDGYITLAMALQFARDNGWHGQEAAFQRALKSSFNVTGWRDACCP